MNKEEVASVFMQIRCNFPDISYLSETQKNNFQFLNKAFLACQTGSVKQQDNIQRFPNAAPITTEVQLDKILALPVIKK